MPGYYYGDDWQRELQQRALDARQSEARERIAAKAKDPAASPEERMKARHSLRLIDG